MTLVDSLVVKPGRTSTGMNNYSKGKGIAEPTETAEGALRDLGYRS